MLGRRGVEDLEQQLRTHESAAVPESARQILKHPRVVEKPTEVELRTLVTLRNGSKSQSRIFLIAPCGGIELSYKGTKVTVLSPSSPLAQLLMGKRKGDVFRARIAEKTEQKYTITSIC